MPSLPRRHLLLAAAALPVLTPLPLRSQTAAAPAAPPPRIVASFSLLADMVREIVPPALEVSALVSHDSDAHVFQPTPAHGRRLAQAGLVVVNGIGFEGWIDRLVKASGYSGPVLVASRGITPRQGGHHGTDPHAWQDLALAKRYVANLREGIGQRWPMHQAEIDQRAGAYLERIDRLDAQVRQQLGAVPREQRRVITSHDAFGYFGAAYGVDFLSPQGWSTHSEPSAAAVARLIRQIQQRQVRALFLENISDRRLIERIASESGARVGGTLYSDALSAPGGPADSYLKMFEHNTRTLIDALAAR